MPLLLASALALAGLTACHGGASAPLAPAAQAQQANVSAAPVPIVPHNDQAVIYNEFGATGSTSLNRDAVTLATIKASLESEGYQVTEIDDPYEGSGRPGQNGGATAENFVKIAQYASVLVINAHGHDFSGNTQSCQKGKGIFVEPIASGSGQPTGGPVPTLSPSDAPCSPLRALLQVQWVDSVAEGQQVEQSLIDSGWDPSWLDLITGVDTFIPADMLDYRDSTYTGKFGEGSKARPALLLTYQGVEHFFGNSHLDFVDNLACHSGALAEAFNATSYVSHYNTACSTYESHDEPLLWSRMTGHYGTDYRPTSSAMAAGGFEDPQFRIDGKPVVLSPAVTAVSPPDGSATSGQGTPVSVTFDAQMSPASAQSDVQVTGCGAQVTDAGTWSNDDTTLSFTVTTDPQSADAQMTLTVPGNQPVVTGDGGNAMLSGNQPQSPQNGEAPNQTAYIWHLDCNRSASPSQPQEATESPTSTSPPGDQPVTITYTGSFTSNGTTLMDNPDQVHGKVDASGSWADTWHVQLIDLQPSPNSGPTFVKGISATTMTVSAKSYQENTNPASTCDQTETTAGNVTLQLYPAKNASPMSPIVAAITNPSMTTGGMAGGTGWTVVSGCDGVMPGVFSAGGIISNGSGLLGTATYAPTIEIPDQYLSQDELSPAGFRSLSHASRHLMTGIFTFDPTDPNTSMTLNYTYTIPPDAGVPAKDNHDDETGGISYTATVTIKVG